MKMSTTHWLVAGALISASTASFAQGKPACGLNNGKPATGAPIPIGAIVGKTGPDDFSASSQAAAAYFKCVNANGGINGRPIEYTIADDQWNPEVAALARKHNDANVLVLPARFVSDEDALAILEAWLTTPFEGGRHQGRVAKIERDDSEADASGSTT